MNKERFEEICSLLEITTDDVLEEVGFEELFYKKNYIPKPFREFLYKKTSELIKPLNTFTREENLKRIEDNSCLVFDLQRELRITTCLENLDNTIGLEDGEY